LKRNNIDNHVAIYIYTTKYRS